MFSSTPKLDARQATRLFYLIAIGLLGLLVLKTGVSTLKDFSRDASWSSAVGLVLVIAGVTLIEFLQRLYRAACGGDER